MRLYGRAQRRSVSRYQDGSGGKSRRKKTSWKAKGYMDQQSQGGPGRVKCSKALAIQLIQD